MCVSLLHVLDTHTGTHINTGLEIRSDMCMALEKFTETVLAHKNICCKTEMYFVDENTSFC